MQQAKALARNSGHLYSARHFIRGREDDIAITLKLSKNISRAANVIDGVIFAVGCCGPYGWIVALILSGAKYLIEENTTWIEDLKDFTAKSYKPIFIGAIGAK